jgi:mono/diheme cytochrome c family protein
LRENVTCIAGFSQWRLFINNLLNKEKVYMSQVDAKGRLHNVLPRQLLWVVGLLPLFALVLAACIQPTPPPGSAAAAMQQETAPAAPAMQGDAKNGAYLVSVIGCGCHANRELKALAGGTKFEGPFGVVYSANLTPDKETGIGEDSVETLVGLLRTGQEQGEDGKIEVLHPVMPYAAFSGLSDKDALDIVTYLLSLPPVKNEVPERELKEDPQPFTPANPAPAEAPTDPVARGAYLVTLQRCGSCHTPKNEDGSPKQDMLLAGAKMQNDVIASNLTPAEGNEISEWSAQDIATLLLTGKEPNGQDIEDPMLGQIKNRFSKLTQEDAMAIAAYLKSLPAVVNDPSK